MLKLYFFYKLKTELKMKKFFLSMMTCTALLTAVTFTSCGDNGDDKPEPPVTEDVLVGSITGTKTLDANVTYTITGAVTVEDGGVLNIPAGTQIKAKKGFNSFEKANNLIYLFIFHYNFIRPHGSLNNCTPAEVAGFASDSLAKNSWFLSCLI